MVCRGELGRYEKPSILHQVVVKLTGDNERPQLPTTVCWDDVDEPHRAIPPRRSHDYPELILLLEKNLHQPRFACDVTQLFEYHVLHSLQFGVRIVCHHHYPFHGPRLSYVRGINRLQKNFGASGTIRLPTHAVNTKEKHPLGCFSLLLKVSIVALLFLSSAESEVSECLVGFCHAVHGFALLHCLPFSLACKDELVGETCAKWSTFLSANAAEDPTK